MIVFDTNIVSEILKESKSNPRVIDWFITLPPQDCYTTAITTAELLYGLALNPIGQKRSMLSDSVRAFLKVYADRTLPFTKEAAPYYASIVATRRHAGRPIGVQDAMIAAIARSWGASVATRNVKDFKDTGVELINPWEYEN